MPALSSCASTLLLRQPVDVSWQDEQHLKTKKRRSSFTADGLLNKDTVALLDGVSTKCVSLPVVFEALPSQEACHPGIQIWIGH